MVARRLNTGSGVRFPGPSLTSIFLVQYYLPMVHSHRHEATPATAFAKEHPCSLVSYHAPTPVMTEYHHSKPIFLQYRLFGKVIYGPDTWVCSNCHDAIHAWLYYLLGEHHKPPHIGRAAKLEAQRTYDWYKSVDDSLS